MDPDVAQQPGRTPRPIMVRLCGMMFLQYFVQGCYLPIISVYLQDALGFDAEQIGYVGAALAVGPLVAPFILGQLVDRHLATQHVLAVCHFAAGAVMLLLYTQSSAGLVVVLGTIYSILYVPSMMLTNALAFHHLANRDREFPLVRLWGTIGFIVPAWLIEFWWLKGVEGDELSTARGVALVLSGVVGLGMGVFSLTLPHTPPPKKDSGDYAPGRVVGLMRMRNFLVLVLVTFGVAIVHQFYFVWNSPYLRAILDVGGIAGAWEQRISSIGQISEIFVMAGLGVAVTVLGFKRTMIVGIVAYILRCVILGGASMMGDPFGLTMTLVCIGQALHGFCFGCFLAAGYMYVDRVAPVDLRGSMQTFYGTFVAAFGFFVGGLIGGWVGEWFTSVSGEETLRESIGVSSTAGLLKFTTEGIEQVRDWPAIWLTSALIGLICLIAFAVAFPRDRKPSEPTS